MTQDITQFDPEPRGHLHDYTELLRSNTITMDDGRQLTLLERVIEARQKHYAWTQLSLWIESAIGVKISAGRLAKIVARESGDDSQTVTESTDKNLL